MWEKRKTIKVALLLLSLLGLIDAIIIRAKISGAVSLSCIVGQGCDSVLYSSYSKFLGVSLSWWGIAFYLVLAVTLALGLIYESKLADNSALLMITAGFVFSLYLFYIQIFKLGSICTYCTISFTDMVLAMTLSGIYRKKKAKSLQG